MAEGKERGAGDASEPIDRASGAADAGEGRAKGAEMKGTISLKEASEMTGACIWTLKQHIYKGSFLAAKPLSDRGGWRIFEEPFRRWWSDRIGATSNRPVAAAKQQGVKI